jgi:protein-S-isoprenylcysteine O-methyltransferase Ste14
MATGILLTVALLVRFYFKRQVRDAERASARHERRERGFYNLVLASFLLGYVYAWGPSLDFAHVDFPMWLRSLGGSTMVAAIGLLWWTHLALGTNWSGILEIYKRHTLVTRGPYRRVRHPMYLGFFIFGVGLLLLTANALVGASYLGAATWMYLVRAPAEEEMMVEHFGDAYRDYMERTGRLLPRLRSKPPAVNDVA